MKRLANALKIVVFLAIGVALFFKVQDVMTQEMDFENADHIIAGIQALEPDAIDVLFVGNSHVQFGVSPMRLYEDTQITSYSVATSAQSIQGHYYMLKKAFQQQSPKVVFVDAAQIYESNDDLNAAWRYILDNLPMDSLKLEMSEAYGEKWYSDGMWSALFPIIKYHTRWSTLTAKDFETGEPTPYYSAGQYVFSKVLGTNLAGEIIDASVDRMLALNESGYAANSDSGMVEQDEFDEPVYAPSISKQNMKWLMDIHALCEEHGAQLVLVKIPLAIYPTHYAQSWTKVKFEQVSEIAGELDIPYLDFMYNTDAGVDLMLDSSDGGWHLNVRGAEKIAAFLGTYLEEELGLNGRADLIYEESLELYQKVREIAFTQSELNFAAYLERLRQHMKDYTVFIVASDNATPGLTEEDYVLLESLGLQMIRDMKEQETYLAVLRGGSVEYEAVSNRRISYKTEIDGKTVELAGSGWYTNPEGTVIIDGAQNARNSRGLNIVVYDNLTGMVIDGVVFDTWSEKKPATRNWTFINDRLRAYEKLVCFGEEDAA